MIDKALIGRLNEIMAEHNLTIEKEIKTMENTNPAQTAFNSDEVKNIMRMKELARSAHTLLKENFNAYCDVSKIIIAGGCFASWFHKEKVKDIDVFVLNYSSEHQAIKNVLRNSQGVRDVTEDYKRDNDNVVGVWNWTEPSYGAQYQFIFTNLTDREALVRDFDMAHTQVSYQYDKIHLTRKTYDAIRDKIMIKTKDKEIVPWRIAKFRDRGWRTENEIGPAPTVGDILGNYAKGANGAAGPTHVISLNMPFMHR